MIPLTPFTLSDFSGGITDNFIDGPANKYRKAENLVITDNRKLITIPGSVLFDADKPQLPSGNQRVNFLREFSGNILAGSAKKLYYENGSLWTVLQGPDTNDVFNQGDSNSYITFGEWNNHLYLANNDYSNVTKLYVDDTATLRARTAGLPSMVAPTIAGGAGAENYIYYLHYVYQYKVGTVTFLDYGPVVQKSIENVAAPDATTIQLTSIPTLTNAGNLNYDTANVKIFIYRTVTNGTVGYKVGEITNGTTIFNDTNADSAIQSNLVVYTNGGVLSNNPPPPCKAIHLANGYGWYGNVLEGTEYITNRLMHSKAEDIDSVPSTHFIDLEDEIVAVSSYLDRVIALCKNSVYRIDGNFDDFGGGTVTRQRISDTFGCVSAQSVVQIQQGVVFASNEGFAFTDGFNTFKISEDFNMTYSEIIQTVNQRERIQGFYDKIEKRVWFTTQTSSGGSDDCDRSYILDTRFGVSPNSSFTTAGGQQEWMPSFMCQTSQGILRADVRGYIFKHSSDYLTHPKVDVLKTPDLWFDSAIMYDFISGASSFGAPDYRKFIPRMVLRAENVSNLAVQIVSLSDLGSRERDIPILKWAGNLVWGDPLFEWGIDEFVWGVPGFIEQSRHFHSDDLRCSYKQLQAKIALVTIIESDSLTTATVNAAAKEVTLDNIIDFQWPDSMGGYSIYFEDDNYTQGFEIDEDTDLNTLTVLDPSGLLTDGSKKWIIKGYPKGNIIKLISLTMSIGPLGKTQNRFSPASLGGNA